MATGTTSLVFSNNTDALFRAWGSWLSGQLAAMGWTLVGQSFATGTSWADVTKPAAANTSRVTELWRMNDALQASAPLYMLLDYGQTAVADSPALRIRLGTGGTAPITLTGQFFDTSTTFFGASAVNTNVATHYCSGSSGRFCVSFSVTATSWAAGNVLGFGIERRKDADGVEQGTGWQFYRYGGSSTRGSITFKQDGSSPNSSMFNSLYFPHVFSAEANLTFDSKIAVAPMMFMCPTPEIGINMVAIPQSHLGPGATFTVDIYGASHTYITMNDIGNLTVLAGAGSAIEGSMRYE